MLQNPGFQFSLSHDSIPVSYEFVQQYAEARQKLRREQNSNYLQ